MNFCCKQFTYLFQLSQKRDLNILITFSRIILNWQRRAQQLALLTFFIFLVTSLVIVRSLKIKNGIMASKKRNRKKGVLNKAN
jgi:hypothetical protein